ncbi:MAG: MFS transporter [Roseivirga sp.]|nr:MFS transporter [Roseivirga sp.]
MIRTISSFFIKPERRAVGLVFFVLSLLFGAWVTRLPEIKETLNLSERELGIALFFMPLGAITLLPFYSAIIAKWGERKATMVGIMGLLVAILLPVLAPTYSWLMAGLYTLGLAMGLTDVAINAAAAEVEKQHQCQIMSASHGFFSLGGMVGAATSGIFIWLDISPFIHLLFWSAVFAILIPLVSKHLLNTLEAQAKSKAFQLPSRAVLGLALIAFCIMMSEGGITDWSTIYIKEDLLASAETAGLGFAGFSALMAIGRFLGDGLIAKYGARYLMILCCSISVMGLGLTLIGSEVSAIAGFSLAGLGYSVIVPILFSKSAKVKGVTPSKGIASVASAGYIGLLVGPVVIGFIANDISLSGGFVFLMSLTGLALIMSLRSSWS